MLAILHVLNLSREIYPQYACMILCESEIKEICILIPYLLPKAFFLLFFSFSCKKQLYWNLGKRVGLEKLMISSDFAALSEVRDYVTGILQADVMSDLCVVM